ncbi:right-handed parallel beta-helix repeat-containing protein [Aquisphaera insulae]|uniref:right-handed parallel beta-helix repeat-containing protein n=1 Tax=Aquisphaera insulae TaxID=2712864 RepID=UPI0013EDBC60|nr:right-handed parallel beta-helix repeat-containing protein [Aquisphaera insulae]
MIRIPGLVLILSLASLASAPITTAARGAPAIVYVSTDGNNAWTGRRPTPSPDGRDGPVASPRRALELARELRKAGLAGEGIRIEIRSGTYFLSDPLTLLPEDSGTQEKPITWAAYRGESPVLSGGTVLSGWTRTKINGRDAWTVRLPGEVVPGAPYAAVRELWVNGVRMRRARWPKSGTLQVAGLSDGEKHDNWSRGVNEFAFEGSDLKGWPGLTSGEAILANRWVESHLPIKAVDESKRVVRFEKRTVFLPEKGDRYWIENVPVHLTEPGEYQYDPNNRTVTLIPTSGVDPNVATVVIPRLAQVLRLAGRPGEGAYVEHVNFRGITFAHGEWFFDHAQLNHPTAEEAAIGWNLKPDASASGFGQAAIGVPGLVAGRGARSCSFVGCTITQAGTYGIELAEGCQGNTISRCTLTDLGAGGIKLGETSIRPEAPRQASGNVVTDCVICDGGYLFPSCVAVWIGQSPGNVIAHNDIHGFLYTGISIGWTWGYGPANAAKNLVEFNHVHHIGKKSDAETPILSDMAGIYTLGNHEGTVIRQNVFHDIAARVYGGWGIYFDEGTTHILAEKNLVYRTTHGGFHQHYGKENTFRNNILAFGRDAQIQRSRVEDHQSFRFEHNIVYWDKGPLLSGDWKKIQASFEGNTYWRTSDPAIRFDQRTWDEWRKAGQDRDSKIADPHLTDPGHDAFGLTASSSEALAGFVPFDVSKAGPRSR